MTQRSTTKKRMCLCAALAAAGTMFLGGHETALGDTVSVPGDQSTIQDAINAADPNDTVEVAPGTYHETLTGFKDGLTLEGAGSDEVTIDVAGSSTNRGINVGNGLTNITLKGFTVTNSDPDDYGLKIQFVDGLEMHDVVAKENGKTGIDLNTVNDANLTDVKAIGNDAAGIALRNVDNVRIAGARTENNAWGGLAMWAPNGESLTQVEVTSSTFTHEPVGIFAQYTGNFADVHLEGNTLEQNDVGFALDDQFGPPDAAAFELTRNNIAGNEERGVLHVGTGTLEATHNWWGHASGPSGPDGRVNPGGETVGKGDAIEGDVNWEPRSPRPH